MGDYPSKRFRQSTDLSDAIFEPALLHVSFNLLQTGLVWFRLNWPGLDYRVFTSDVTSAMLVYLNNRTAAMLVSPTNPLGIELFYHATLFLCFRGKRWLLIT